jgi:hypothetical protein
MVFKPRSGSERLFLQQIKRKQEEAEEEKLTREEREEREERQRQERESARDDKLSSYGYSVKYGSAMGRLQHTNPETGQIRVSDVEAHSFEIMELNGIKEYVIVAKLGAMSRLVNPANLAYCEIVASSSQDEENLLKLIRVDSREGIEPGFHEIEHISGNRFRGNVGSTEIDFYLPELQQ